jgi:dihydropteroate synthase
VQLPQIIGILNITPDSFFDGGKFADTEKAVLRAEQMQEEGADVIEIGGESTGPGSKDISAEEELRRTIPVIKELRSSKPDMRISIDTYKSAVARAAIAEGATIVNDVTSGRADPEILRLVAQCGASLVLMYAKDATPRTTVEPKKYEDVVATIHRFLEERKQAAMASGIPASRIILDPGLGHFVSSLPEYSFEILDRLREFLDLGCDLLVSPSRKSFLAGAEKIPVSERLPQTIVASVIALQNGARFIRTHDVAEIRRAIDVAQAIGFRK